MSLESVREFFQSKNLDIPIIELDVSTATVALAAEAHGVEHGRIAKILAFRLADGRVILLVANGDARVNHKKFKAELGKGKMLGLDEVVELTGHPVGGVCPFGLAHSLPIAAATRELHEETGLVAISLRFLFHHESPTNLHHVYFCESEGVPLAADDAETLLYLDQPAKESSLNLSPATRTILTRFEAWWQASMKIGGHGHV